MGSSIGGYILSGDGWYIEHTKLKYFNFYKRTRVQIWTMYRSEIEVETGLRVGRVRFGVTRSFLEFTHHQTGEISIEKKRYSL